jgi:hypothetical protein
MSISPGALTRTWRYSVSAADHRPFQARIRPRQPCASRSAGESAIRCSTTASPASSCWRRMNSRSCCSQSLAGICATDATPKRNTSTIWNPVRGFDLHRCCPGDVIGLKGNCEIRRRRFAHRFPVSIGILASNLNSGGAICCKQRRYLPSPMRIGKTGGGLRF